MTDYLPGACKGQKRVSEPLELVADAMWLVGNSLSALRTECS